MHSFAPGQESSLPLGPSSAATLQSIRSGCQKQDHTGAILNSPLNSLRAGRMSYSSCLDPRALNLINCSLRGQKLERQEQWITLFSAVLIVLHGQIIWSIWFSFYFSHRQMTCNSAEWGNDHMNFCLASFRSDLMTRATPLALNLHSGLGCEAQSKELWGACTP